MSVTTNLVVAGLGLSTLGGAAYKVAKTDVNVVNTPTVHVATLPTVVVQDLREPVFFKFELSSEALVQSLADEDSYTVPAGKRLTVTHVSGAIATPTNVYATVLGITAGTSAYSARVTHNLVPVFASLNSSGYNIYNISQEINFVANAGELVGFYFGRSSAYVVDPAANAYVNVSGYLEPAP